MQLQFPEHYRGVDLTLVEREVISEFLHEMPDGVSEEQRQWVEHLFVADALCLYANELIDQAQRTIGTSWV